MNEILFVLSVEVLLAVKVMPWTLAVHFGISILAYVLLIDTISADC